MNSLVISDKQDEKNEEVVFSYYPVAVSRWDYCMHEWRPRGAGQVMIYYNKQIKLAKIVFSTPKTQLLQYINGENHADLRQYQSIQQANDQDINDNMISIEWSGTDYTLHNDPIHGKWRMEFINDLNIAQKVMNIFKFYINKNIDPSDLLVYGYLRLHCNYHKNNNIPTDLETLCVSIYRNLLDKDIKIEHKTDEWRQEISHKHLEFLESYNTVTKSLWPNTCFNAFGSLMIGKGEIKIWKLKLFSIDPAVCIGIISADRFHPNKDKLFFDEETSFGIYTRNGCKYQNKEPKKADYFVNCDQNDLIAMTLNMTGKEFGTLSFKKNNTDYGIAFDNIDLNKKYYIAVSILNCNVIQLLP